MPMKQSETLRGRSLVLLVAVLLLTALTWLWKKTSSLNPEDHAQVDSALRELRSLDRTINQDVLRARFQLIANYEPVLCSYRRTEELEAAIATPPRYLNEAARANLSAAMTEYRASVTRKQVLIESFKYRTADLKDLLGYLPGAGTGVAKAASDAGDERLARDVNRVLQQALLYNLTSEEKYAPILRVEIEALLSTAEQTRSDEVKKRVRTLALNIRNLVEVKPSVDRLLIGIFAEPIVHHEEKVASIYYTGYAAAENTARQYRMVMYGLCLALLAVVVYAVRRLQMTAKALALSNELLEERVVERTRELDVRNLEMRAVLDNVDQALFTVDLAGRLSRERSAALDRWFPQAVPGALLPTVLESMNPKVATWVELGWEQLRDGFLPSELILDQLPRQLDANNRHYEMGFRPIGAADSIDKILLVVSDVTEAVERAKRDKDQQEQLVVFRHMMRDRSGFMEYFTEAEHLASIVLSGASGPAATRAVHTLKGNSGLFGVTSIVEVCHELETKIIGTDDPLGPDDRAQFVDAWTSFSEKVRSLAGAAQEAPVEFSRSDVQALRKAIVAGCSGRELYLLLRQAEREPAERRLARIAEQAKALARRLGKGEIQVDTEPNDVRLDAKRWAPFWGAFVHMLRNAVDHGLETPEERQAVGKPVPGRLIVRTQKAGDRILVEIADDGRGIDAQAVRLKATELGLSAATEEELFHALFHGGVTTKTTVNEFSGRGTGVSACHNACLDLGGSVSIRSERGRGTTFQFLIPSDDTVSTSVVPPA